jgi:transposase
VQAIAKVAFTSEDRVRDVIRNFNADGFGSLFPKYRGRPPAEVQPGPAAGDQEDRQVQARRA